MTNQISSNKNKFYFSYSGYGKGILPEYLNNIEDIIPRLNDNSNRFNEDLKIIDFSLYPLKCRGNIYFVPIYILTDRILSSFNKVYETVVRIGFYPDCEFLSIQDQCFSKLESYSQHKRVYKKLHNGIYDKEILKLIEGRCLIKC